MKKFLKEKNFWLYFFLFFFIINISTVLLYKIFMLLKPYPYTLKNKISIEFILKKQLYHISNIKKANWKMIVICCIRNFSAVLAFYSLIIIAKYITLSNKIKDKDKYYAIRSLIFGFLIFFVGIIFKRSRAMTKIFFLTSNDSLINNFSILFLLLMWHETLEYSALIISSYPTIVNILSKINIIKNDNTEETKCTFIFFCDNIIKSFKPVALVCFILLSIAGYIEIQLTPIGKFYDSSPPFFNK